MAWGYCSLITGMIIVGCVMPFLDTGWTIINAALLAIVAGKISPSPDGRLSHRAGFPGAAGHPVEHEARSRGRGARTRAACEPTVR
jgi:hypothetical protein